VAPGAIIPHISREQTAKMASDGDSNMLRSPSIHIVAKDGENRHNAINLSAGKRPVNVPPN